MYYTIKIDDDKTNDNRENLLSHRGGTPLLTTSQWSFLTHLKSMVMCPKMALMLWRS